MSKFLQIDNPMIRGLLVELSTLLLSAAAFALSLNRPSIIVSMVLIVTGALRSWTASQLVPGTLRP